MNTLTEQGRVPVKIWADGVDIEQEAINITEREVLQAVDDWQQIRRLGGYYDPNFMFADAFVAKRLGITIEEDSRS